MNRQMWKIYYRMLRIIRRESFKASTDMLLYGTGYVIVTGDLLDPCHHVPIEEILL